MKQEDNPHPFLQCGKCFRTTNRLKMHQISHTGEKRFNCQMCGKNFTNNTKVKRHQSYHCKALKEKECPVPAIEGIYEPLFHTIPERKPNIEPMNILAVNNIE